MLSHRKSAAPGTGVALGGRRSIQKTRFAPCATVTLPASRVRDSPSDPGWSSGAAGVIAAPAMVLVGWTLKLSCVAAPAVMLNGVEVVPLRLPPLAVSV